MEHIVNLKNEKWKPIVGFEGLYEVSNYGRIKSIGREKKKHKKDIIMKAQINKGYLRINLHKNNESYYFFVHRLVYEAFVGKIPKFEHKGSGHGDEMLEINHIDEDKTNNRLDNLELVTRTQNNNHGSRIKKMARTLGKQVYQYTKDGVLVNIWYSTKDCRKTGGYNQGAVSACCRGKRKSHMGYLWSFVPL